MQKLTILSFLFLLCSHFSFAQISEEERSMTQGMNNAMMMTISNADDKAVEKLWKKYMKTMDSKTKKIKRSEEWFSDNANISGVGASVDVYATFEQSGDEVKMTAWLNMDGTYFNSSTHPDKYASAEDFLNAFELEVYKDGVRSEIKFEENNMKKLESNLKKLKKSNKRLHAEIEAAKKKIEKAEANIETNLLEQEEVNIKIEAQKEVVEKTKKKMEDRDN